MGNKYIIALGESKAVALVEGSDLGQSLPDHKPFCTVRKGLACETREVVRVGLCDSHKLVQTVFELLQKSSQHIVLSFCQENVPYFCTQNQKS